jgi:hypothetical protein
MDLIHSRRLKWVAPVGLALTAHRLWRRRAPRQEPRPGTVDPVTPSAWPEPPSRSVAEHVAAATAPSEEVVPGDLTSPGTVSDPRLEERRAEEAAERERESRESSMTKFDELRLQEDAERHEHAAVVADPPAER